MQCLCCSGNKGHKMNYKIIIQSIVVLIILTLLSSFANAGINQSNLIYNWKMDSDTNRTDSVSSITLTAGNNPLHLLNGSCKIGDGCYQFVSTSSQYLQVTSGVTKANSINKVSVSWWFKYTNSGSTFSNNFAPYTLGSAAGSKWGGQYANTLTYYETRLDSSIAPNDGDANSGNVIGDWHLITITWDGTNERVYTDGTLSNTAGMTGVTKNMSGYFTMGASYTGAFSNYLQGWMDDFCIWNITLPTDSITALYNGGVGAACYTSATNFTITGTVNVFNATIGSTVYNATSGTIITGILSTDTTPYNITINAENKFTISKVNYNVTSDLNVNFTEYPKVFVHNDWNLSALNGITLNINNYNYSNVSGYFTFVPFNTTVNVSVSALNYISRIIEWNFANQNNLNTTIWQSVVNLTAYQIITGANISSWNISTPHGVISTTTQNLTLRPNIDDTYTLQAKSLNYVDQNRTFTVSALSHNYNVTFYSSVLNMTVYSTLGSPITTYVMNLTAIGSGHKQVANTTNGYIEFNLLYNDSYLILLDAESYSLANATFNISQGVQYSVYNFTIPTTNSITFNFYDEITQNILSGINITIELIGQYVSYNGTTTTGQYFKDLITPDSYTIRYEGLGYVERFYYFTLVNRTTNELDLYLLQSSSSDNVTATVYDEGGHTVENANIKVLRYDIISNSYILQEMRLTNNEGQALLHLQLNAEFYKFYIEYPLGTTKLTTSPRYVTTNTIVFEINLNTLFASKFFNSLGVDHTLSFNNNTNNFRFDYNDNLNTMYQSCVNIYRKTIATSSLYNSSCSVSTSGSILLGVEEINGTTYEANAYLYFNETPYFAESAIHSFDEKAQSGKLGIFIAIILTIVAIGVSAFNPIIVLIMTPLPVLALAITGFIDIPVWIIIGIVVSGIIVAFLLSRRS